LTGRNSLTASYGTMGVFSEISTSGGGLEEGDVHHGFAGDQDCYAAVTSCPAEEKRVVVNPGTPEGLPLSSGSSGKLPLDVLTHRGVGWDFWLRGDTPWRGWYCTTRDPGVDQCYTFLGGGPVGVPRGMRRRKKSRMGMDRREPVVSQG